MAFQHEIGSLNVVMQLTDEDVQSIAAAYLAKEDAKRSTLYSKEFVCPMDAQVKVRLSVPGNPDLKQRCIWLELFIEGQPRDYALMKQGFDDMVIVLQIPKEVRVIAQIDLSKVKVPIPRLPSPTYD